MPFSSFFTTRSEKGHKRRGLLRNESSFLNSPLLYFCYSNAAVPLPSSELLKYLERGAREDGFQHALNGLLRIGPPAVVMGVVCEHIFEGLCLEVTPEPFPCR